MMAKHRPPMSAVVMLQFNLLRACVESLDRFNTYKANSRFIETPRLRVTESYQRRRTIRRTRLLDSEVTSILKAHTQISLLSIPCNSMTTPK
jgi:hypothetical protein